MKTGTADIVWFTSGIKNVNLVLSQSINLLNNIFA